ncbi:MAG: hypothetical protein K2K45_07100 [Muribaculaceae bacterium]|nr:hypothetical protein [Muribaculaceae bacterium]
MTTYREYFRYSDFEEVWKTLSEIYKEPEEARPLYEAVHQSVCEMEEDKSKSTEKIAAFISANGDLKISGAPDPQEWLAGREVVIDYDPDDKKGHNVNELVGGLLYWSTLYGIKTRKMQKEGFSKWLDYGMRGPFYTIPDNDFDKIGEGVMVKYIFLDFDGVLNTEQYHSQLAIEGKPTKDEFGPLFDPKAVARLGEIVEATKAEIYVISSWGEVLGADKIVEMWEKRELPGKVPDVYIPDDKCCSKAQWIKKCINDMMFLPYIILDDEAIFLPEQEDHVIKINPVTGISKENAEQSIAILNELDNLPVSAFEDKAYEEERERIYRINKESSNRKKLRFWRETVVNDEAYDWSWNLTILRKKLEYNIGYYRFTQRYDGWKKDVERMALACRLMKIAVGEDSIYEKDTYVNIRNCSRFEVKAAEFEEDSKFIELHRDELRENKAFQLVWTILRQNMKYWWD